MLDLVLSCRSASTFRLPPASRPPSPLLPPCLETPCPSSLLLPLFCDPSLPGKILAPFSSLCLAVGSHAWNPALAAVQGTCHASSPTSSSRAEPSGLTIKTAMIFGPGRLADPGYVAMTMGTQAHDVAPGSAVSYLRDARRFIIWMLSRSAGSSPAGYCYGLREVRLILCLWSAGGSSAGYCQGLRKVRQLDTVTVCGRFVCWILLRLLG